MYVVVSTTYCVVFFVLFSIFRLHGNTSDTEVDEGVDMGGDSESLEQSDSPSVPTLHVIPSLQAEIANRNLPQILVPK